MSSNNLFTSTPVPKLKKNSIDLSHEKKFTCDMGELRVIYWDDIIPGDTFDVSSEVFIRFGPMLAPVLHRIDVFVHYFWVPYRQIWNPVANSGGFEAFITGDPEEIYTSTIMPFVTMNNTTKSYFGNGYLTGDFGLPSIESHAGVTQDVDICALPFVAYQWIYDNYYRDENLIDKICGKGGNSQVVFNMIGGDLNSVYDHVLEGKYRCWEKDYFTSALPTAYKGLTSDVELDLDIIHEASTTSFYTTGGVAPTAGAISVNASGTLQDSAAANIELRRDTSTNVLLAHSATLEIMELRRAQALLRYYEAANRGGHRYTEHLLGVYGVISDDRRLQIPKYLGGGKQNVQISEVLNTSQAMDPTAGKYDGGDGVPVTVDPQANLAGKGLTMGRTNRFKETFNEHGIVIGIMSVLPRTGYYGGIDKYWRKDHRTDFFIPQLQHIGEQEILQSEIYYDPTGTDKDDVFGYTPRYAEYKFKNDKVSGLFATSFDYWHCNRMITSAPALNEAFVKANPSNDEMNRIFAVESGTDNIFVQVYNNVRALRPMSFYSVPI